MKTQAILIMIFISLLFLSACSKDDSSTASSDISSFVKSDNSTINSALKSTTESSQLSNSIASYSSATNSSKQTSTSIITSSSYSSSQSSDTNTKKSSSSAEITSSASNIESSQAGEKQLVHIIIGNKTFTSTLADNEAAKAFYAQLPLTVSMSDLNNREKYYHMPNNLPSNFTEKPNTINAGDLMCWSGSSLVLFYKTFSNSYGGYVRLGTVDQANELVSELGKEDVIVSFLRVT